MPYGGVADGWETPGPLVGLPWTKPAPSQPPRHRLLFMLTYVKTYALQVVQGRLFGLVQSKANRWIHVLLPALLVALRALGDAPARFPHGPGTAARHLRG
jgi:hypothetical protein